MLSSVHNTPKLIYTLNKKIIYVQESRLKRDQLNHNEPTTDRINILQIDRLNHM
jgi:hypothetical protein